MKLQVIVHESEEGGYWAEFPALPGCFTQAETWDELMGNIREVVELYFSPRETPPLDAKARLIELSL